MKNPIPHFWLLILMKKRLPEISTFKLFSKKILRVGFFILLLNLMAGCFNFYKVTTKNSADQSEINTHTGYNKVFIIHNGTNVYAIGYISISNDSIKGKLLSENYQFPYMVNTFPAPNSTNKYRKKHGDQRLINEVHLYINPPEKDAKNKTSVAFKDINRIDVYNHDYGRTALSWVLGAVVGITGAYVVLILILLTGLLVFSIGGSCPYVYVNNGTDFELAGELYSGAIYSSLERNDYLNLPHLLAKDGKYLLKISNELQEVQNTNLTELLVIDHPVNSKVLIDKYGNYQTFTNPASPVTALNNHGTDILKTIEIKDSLSYLGSPDLSNVPYFEELTLKFDKPANAKNAKVLIRAKNTLWLENVYAENRELMGSYSKMWTDKQNKSDGEKMREWMVSQKIPLLLYVEKNGKWNFCDYFNMAGPLSLKEDVISIDISDLPAGPLKLKFETGSYFWELDYVGIDYSKNIPVKITAEKIEKAINENEDNLTDLLKYDDLRYYVQAHNYNSADLIFNEPPRIEGERTVILHSKGYYQINHEVKGLPHIKKLKTIQKPGHFAEYSKELINSGIKKMNYH